LPAPNVSAPTALVAAWRASAHASEKVGCMACHGKKDDGAFVQSPGTQGCTSCHQSESETFGAGKHGIRTALGLSPLEPKMARAKMAPHANGTMTCGTCHDPHGLDTQRAAVDACLSCHADDHSVAYRSSPHARTFATAANEGRPAATAVTCATCHLPRTTIQDNGKPRVAVNHDNAFTMRPKERMAKAVCSSCHGLAFSLNSLHDDALVRSNFARRPEAEIQTISMIRTLEQEKKKGVHE
jgi:formate-dependent nitrite reductase cytochrome c552 subunit